MVVYMEDPTKRAIEKLKIIKEMSNSSETNQICKVMIEWLKDYIEKPEMGFTASGDKGDAK